MFGKSEGQGGAADSCWVCCNKASGVDDGLADFLPDNSPATKIFETVGLLEADSGPDASEGGHSLCCKVCAACWCLVLVALAALGVFVFICVQGVKDQTSIVESLVKDGNGGQYFRLANMSHIPAYQWAAYEGGLMDTWETDTGYSFGYASVTNAPELLYKASKVDGVFDKVPEKLRGVYWMRGNPIPEVLAVIHYGHWDEEQQTLLLPNTPWTWAWWGGSSREYPDGLDPVSKLVYTFASGKDIAESYIDDSALDTLVSFKFGPCPADTNCQEGSEGLSYASLMSHPDGDMSKHGMSYYDGYTMEEHGTDEVANKKQRPGAQYFRRAEMFCGLFGKGSGYELTKILDGDGNKVEPFYTQYLKFMADRPLIIWSGMPENKLPENAAMNPPKD